MSIDWSKFLRIGNHFFKTYSIWDDIECHQGDYNRTGSITIPLSGLFNAYGFIANYLEYLTCKLGLSINLVPETCSKMNDTSHICFLKKGFSVEQEHLTLYQTITSYYSVELVSILNHDQDLSYLLYRKLFSHQIWILLFLFISVYSILLKNLSKQGFSFFRIVFNLAGFYLAQPMKLISIIKMNRAIFILLFIWLLNSSILTRCFNSVLLKTFFKTKPSLTAETLEQIVDNPDINVIGKSDLGEIEISEPRIYGILIKRLDIYEKHLNMSNESPMNIIGKTGARKDLVERKLVILINSKTTQTIKLLFNELNLMESEHKYGQQFIHSYVSKTHPNSRQIYRMFKSQLEMGIVDRTIYVLEKVAKIYINTNPNKDDQGAQTASRNLELDTKIGLTMFFRGPGFTIVICTVFAMIVFVIEKVSVLGLV